MELCQPNATNTTNCFIEKDMGDIVVPLPRWVLPLKLSYMLFIIIVGVAGNGLIILVQLKNRRKSSTDCFVVLMATSDAVLAGVVGNIHALECLPTVWNAVVSDALCKFFSFFIYCTTFASTQLLSAIAFDRFRLTCRPHSRILDTRKAAMACGLIAIDSLVVCSLTPVLFHVNDAGNRCTRRDDLMIEATIFDIALATSFIVMFVVVIVCYSKVAYALRRHHRAKAQQQTSLGSEVASTMVSDPKQVLRKKFRRHRVGAIAIDVGDKSVTFQPNSRQANDNFSTPDVSINADKFGVAHGHRNEMVASTSTPLESYNSMVVSGNLEAVGSYACLKAKDSLMLTNANDNPVLTKANENPMFLDASGNPMITNAHDNLILTNARDNPMLRNDNDNRMLTKANDNPTLTNVNNNRMLTKANDNLMLTHAIDNPMLTNAHENSVLTNASVNPMLTDARDNPMWTNAIDNPLMTNARDNPLLTNAIVNSLLTDAIDNPLLTNSSNDPMLTDASDNSKRANASDNPLLTNASENSIHTNAIDNPLLTNASVNSMLTYACDNPSRREANTNSMTTNADDNPMLTSQRLTTKRITEESARINRTTVLMFLITAVYTLSWLTYFGIDTYLSIGDQRGSKEGRLLMTMSGMLYMVNSIANPVFYILLSSVFRSRVMDTFPCCRSVSWTSFGCSGVLRPFQK